MVDGDLLSKLWVVLYLALDALAEDFPEFVEVSQILLASLLLFVYCFQLWLLVLGNEFELLAIIKRFDFDDFIMLQISN